MSKSLRKISINFGENSRKVKNTLKRKKSFNLKSKKEVKSRVVYSYYMRDLVAIVRKVQEGAALDRVEEERFEHFRQNFNLCQKLLKNKNQNAKPKYPFFINIR